LDSDKIITDAMTHSSSKLYPDPHSLKRLDPNPDPHKIDVEPKTGLGIPVMNGECLATMVIPLIFQRTAGKTDGIFLRMISCPSVF
jgi:hypothetical protein